MRQADWLNYLDSYSFHQQDKETKQKLYSDLFIAVKNKYEKNIEKLVRIGVNLNYVINNTYALKEAIIAKDVHMVSYLHKMGASFLTYDLEYKPPLYYAIDVGDELILSYILNKRLYNPYKTKKLLQTPLLNSTIKSNLNMVKYIAYKTKVNINECDYLGNNALFYNFSKPERNADDREIGIILMELGGDMDAANLAGETARMYADGSLTIKSDIESHQINEEIKEVIGNKFNKLPQNKRKNKI